MNKPAMIRIKREKLRLLVLEMLCDDGWHNPKQLCDAMAFKGSVSIDDVYERLIALQFEGVVEAQVDERRVPSFHLVWYGD